MSSYRRLTLVSRVRLPRPGSRGCPTFRAFRKVGKQRTGWVHALVLILALAAPASAEWKEKVLYSFQGGSDGAVPAGGVAFDKAGNLYGATTYTPSCDDTFTCGTAFELSLQGGTWVETTLHAFQGHAQGDGGAPGGGVILDASGNVFGTTGYGGTGGCILLGTAVGCGTVYELSPPTQNGGQWTYAILYNFQGGNDGQFPWGDLVFDKKGNLYGATQFGGGKGNTCDPGFYQYCGTVFELSPPRQKGGAWKEKVLHSFAGIASGKQYGDAESPNGGLILDGKGTIYGTSFNGGYTCDNNGAGCGTVFELKPPDKKGGAWKEQLIHVFKAGNDGSSPSAGVIFGADGSLYGGGGAGAKHGGVVFRFAPAAGGRWKETAVHEFSNKQYDYGYEPSASLFDSAGNLYGITDTAPPGGSVFRLVPPTGKGKHWTLDFLCQFGGYQDGGWPNSHVVRGKAGDLYGATQYGGSGQACQGGCGTVFEVSP